MSAAYTAIKYANTVVMALAAIPTYLLARTMVSTRAAAIAALAVLCTSAFFYAGFLLPEVLAYPTFVLCALGLDSRARRRRPLVDRRGDRAEPRWPRRCAAS